MIDIPTADSMNGKNSGDSNVEQSIEAIVNRICSANSKGKKNTKFNSKNKKLLDYLGLLLEAHGYKTYIFYYDDDWGTYTLNISWNKYD